MTQLSKNYAVALYSLGISREAIDATRELVAVRELIEALSSPIVSKQTKHRIVEKIFPASMKNFMKLLCDYNSVEYINEILDAYHSYVNELNGVLDAELVCVTAPTKEQIKNMEQFLTGEYEKSHISLKILFDESLIGGFILKVENVEYDWSLKGRISQLAGHLNNI